MEHQTLCADAHHDFSYSQKCCRIDLLGGNKVIRRGYKNAYVYSTETNSVKSLLYSHWSWKHYYPITGKHIYNVSHVMWGYCARMEYYMLNKHSSCFLNFFSFSKTCLIRILHLNQNGIVMSIQTYPYYNAHYSSGFAQNTHAK